MERSESVEAYIIHFDDKPWQDLDNELYYRCFEIPWFSTTKTTISRLTPYTEDSAYAHGYTEAESKYREIRDELEKQAYQRGYEGAYDTAYADAEEIYDSGKRVMYQKGLKDAWEAARKICLEECDGGMQISVIKDIFNVSYYRDALRDYSASECIEKIRAYELEKEEIQLWDEVINGRNFKGTVTDIKDDGMLTIFCQDGTWINSHTRFWKKTGRHFPEIAEVLQKMKENNDNK